MNTNERKLTHHSHFQYHMKHGIPVQVYELGSHIDIGLITAVDAYFVELEGTLYNRGTFTFISRPGY
ncbi:hypothetical protein [Paenibacillus solani]|uniref:hypothetical protein n=1 Tax=Paenibacillus solani TaxID=1705565 RepID=UPI003D2824FC